MTLASPAPRISSSLTSRGSSELRPLLIGAGNRDRGDDAAGRVLIDRLRQRGDLPFICVECSGEATALMELFAGREKVIIIDACHSRGAAGTILHFDAAAAPLPVALSTSSSHGFGVAAGIELARALGDLPLELDVFAIEADSCEQGSALTPAVDAAIDKLAEKLLCDYDDGRPIEDG